MDGRIVKPFGPVPNRVLVVGEAPGREEANRGRPFVGKSGREQEALVRRYGLSTRGWRLANVVGEYRKGNPDPTRTQVEEWTPRLMSEIERVEPEVIVAVGRFAARWFLGEGVTMEAVHGLPQRAGAMDPQRAGRGGPRGAVVVPVTHPAAGLRAGNGELRGVVEWDYERAVGVVKAVKSGEAVETVEDRYRGREVYSDVTGSVFAKMVDSLVGAATEAGVDTEGTTSEPWSIQVSTVEGHALTLRCAHTDFMRGVDALRRLFDSGVTAVFHNAMYDVPMCRAMGLDLSRADLVDTMVGAYLTRLEPQGLKPLAWRWCGMAMRSYQEVVGGVAKGKQLEYLMRAWEVSKPWPRPEPRIVHENDGTDRIYQPQKLSATIERALVDIAAEKRNKDGVKANPWDRWKTISRELRRPVERELGPMPWGSLEDVERGEAVEYAGRDADATLRVWKKLKVELERRGLT